MIYLFKRVGLLLSLMVVEILVWIVFILFYTELLWVSWDSTKAIYTIVAIIPIFILTLAIYLRVRKELSNIVNTTISIDATLTNKNRIRLLQRSLFFWTYEYERNRIIYRKTYWSLADIRELEIGDSFVLAVNPDNYEKSYFPYYDTN